MSDAVALAFSDYDDTLRRAGSSIAHSGYLTKDEVEAIERAREALVKALQHAVAQSLLAEADVRQFSRRGIPSDFTHYDGWRAAAKFVEQINVG